MYIVTIRRPDGYEFNHSVEGPRLKHFLELASSVLLLGETLSYRHA